VVDFKATTEVTIQAADFEATDAGLGAISGSVKSGRTALLVVVTEQSPEVVDVAMSGLGGTVLHRPVADLAAEITGPEEAELKPSGKPARSCSGGAASTTGPP
jgi:hypothetical protein